MRITFVSLCVLIFSPLSAAAGEPPIHIPSNGWTLVFQHDGIVVQERSVPGYPMKAYRAKGILKAPIEKILEVLSNTAATAEWMPELDHQKVIAVISDVELITLHVYGVPFPFADRELLLHNRLRLDRPGKALVAEAVSIDEPKISTGRRRVRARMIYSKTRLCPVGAELTEIEFVIMADPGGSIPDFLAAFGLRRMLLNFVRALESRAQSSQHSLRSTYKALLKELEGSQADVHGSSNTQDLPVESQAKKVLCTTVQ